MEHDPGALTPSQTVAKRVREIREQRHLTAAQLAEKMTAAGVPWKRATVAKLETGRRQTVSIDEVVALARVLDAPVGYLTGTYDDQFLERLSDRLDRFRELARDEMVDRFLNDDEQIAKLADKIAPALGRRYGITVQRVDRPTEPPQPGKAGSDG